jgi:hypothetical protein
MRDYMQTDESCQLHTGTGSMENKFFPAVTVTVCINLIRLVILTAPETYGLTGEHNNCVDSEIFGDFNACSCTSKMSHYFHENKAELGVTPMLFSLWT